MDEVVRQIGGLGKAEVPGAMIGQMVMEALKALDHVAYVRFCQRVPQLHGLGELRPGSGGAAAGPGPHVDAALSAQLSLPMAGGETREKTVRRPKKNPAGDSTLSSPSAATGPYRSLAVPSRYIKGGT